MQLSTYGKLRSELYAADDEAPAAMLQFYLDSYAQTGGPALEPMCGTGRFLIPFLERGIDIDGVDASPYMLQACREHGAAKGLKPQVYEQLVQAIELPRRYGYIFMPDSQFALLYDKAVALTALKRLHDHLLPGGKIVLDVRPPGIYSFPTGQWLGDWQQRPDGATVVTSDLFHFEEGDRVLRSISKTERFVANRLVETELDFYIQRLYDEAEFTSMLASVGFVDVQVYQAKALGISNFADLVFEGRKSK